MTIIVAKLKSVKLKPFLKRASQFLLSGSHDPETAVALVLELRRIIDPNPSETEFGDLRGYLQVKEHRRVLRGLAPIAGYRFTYDTIIAECGWHEGTRAVRRQLREDEVDEEGLRDCFEVKLSEKPWRLPVLLSKEERREVERYARTKRKRSKLQENFEVELVPRGCWGRNLRSLLAEEDWEKVRRRTARAARNECEVCGGRGDQWPVEVHERWHYDDETHIQRLVGLIALCPACHQLKHWGHTKQLSPTHSFEALHRLAGFRRISLEAARAYLDQQEEIARRRSKHTWSVDLSWLGRTGFESLLKPRDISDADSVASDSTAPIRRCDA